MIHICIRKRALLKERLDPSQFAGIPMDPAQDFCLTRPKCEAGLIRRHGTSSRKLLRDRHRRASYENFLHPKRNQPFARNSRVTC